MITLLMKLLSLAAAGTMMTSAAMDTAAPQHDPDGLLFLANRTWRVSKAFVPEYRLTNVPGQVRNLRDDAARALEKMFAACKEEIGITLVSVSGYRSYAKQTNIYNAKVKNVGSKAKADEYVARPGASEHQLALAMDVGQKGKTNLNAGFARTEGGKWLAENCWRFGFIIRYQQGWEDITGYEYEPWHVRYVGTEYAKMISEKNVPFETFMKDLRESILLDIVEGN